MAHNEYGSGHGRHGPFVDGYNHGWQLPPQPQLQRRSPQARQEPQVSARGRDQLTEAFHAPGQRMHPAGGELPPTEAQAADSLGPIVAGFGATASTFTNLMGAALSIALVGGLGIWGYKLLVRDVTGVPVVAALEGPMRVAPEDPGGSTAAHQGLAVNAIAAEGEAEAPADRLVLAPRPVELTDEDRPMADLQPEAEIETDDDELMLTAQTDAEAGEVQALPSNDPVAVALALADQIAAEATPLEGGNPDDEGTTSQAALDIPAGGVSRSPRPKARPSGLREASLAARDAIATSASDDGIVDVDPATIEAGTKLVQFGAYDSADKARSEWVRLADTFGEYLEGKSRVIQKAQSGGKTFYRLRAMGFTDLADARRFCAAMVAKEAGCIPAVAR